MKFDESFDLCLDEKYMVKTFVYFLSCQNEVIYVGKTTNGFFRPFTHKNKKFDSIYIKKCDTKDLDKIETYYIIKYNPIYNNDVNGIGRVKKIRDKIREVSGKKYSIVHARNLIESIGITIGCFKGYEYLGDDDYNTVLKYIDNNNDVIKELSK